MGPQGGSDVEDKSLVTRSEKEIWLTTFELPGS